MELTYSFRSDITNKWCTGAREMAEQLRPHTAFVEGESSVHRTHTE